MFQTEGIAGVKALGQEDISTLQGTTRRPMLLEQDEK